MNDFSYSFHRKFQVTALTPLFSTHCILESVNEEREYRCCDSLQIPEVKNMVRVDAASVNVAGAAGGNTRCTEKCDARKRLRRSSRANNAETPGVQ